MRPHLLTVLALLLLHTLPIPRAEAQAVIPDDDPRARLAAGFLQPLMAGDGAAAEAFVRAHAAPGTDPETLVERMGRLAAAVEGLADRRIVEFMALPNGVGGARLDDGTAIFVETSGEPPRIANLIMGRIRRQGDDPAPAPAARFRSLDALDEHLTEAAARERFSGVVLAARSGEALFHRAYGLADRERGVAVRADTRFDLGSIDKAFTGVAVLRLAQEGRLGLDEPIGTYVRGLSASLAGATVRQLLQHRGGAGDYLAIPAFQADPARFATVDALLELIRGREADFEPGSQQRYSNAGFVLLGAAVAGLTGRPYHSVVREWVLEPAGMLHTGPERTPDVAVPYTRGRPGSDGPLARSTFGSVPTPAGGGYSTAEDLRRFLRAAVEGRLLDAAHTDLLLNSYDAPARAGLRPARYGIAGGAPGINAFAEIDRQTDEVVVVLSNLDPPAAQGLGSTLLDQLRDL